jgi:hypothetical protein
MREGVMVNWILGVKDSVLVRCWLVIQDMDVEKRERETRADWRDGELGKE